MSITGLISGSPSLLSQPAQSLEQSDVFGLQLFDQTLSGALVDHSSVLDTLCPKEERGVSAQGVGVGKESMLLIMVVNCQDLVSTTSQHSAGLTETPHSRDQLGSVWQSAKSNDLQN